MARTLIGETKSNCLSHPQQCEQIGLVQYHTLNGHANTIYTSTSKLPINCIRMSASFISLKSFTKLGYSQIALVVQSMSITFYREHKNCQSHYTNIILRPFVHIYKFTKIFNKWHLYSQWQEYWVIQLRLAICAVQLNHCLFDQCRS